MLEFDRVGFELFHLWLRKQNGILSLELENLEQNDKKAKNLITNSFLSLEKKVNR
jgi:hypothetical protein